MFNDVNYIFLSTMSGRAQSRPYTVLDFKSLLTACLVSAQALRGDSY
ncbi:hypothetical protein MTsPCn5_30940 [Croceitalea sp. MTPC5]|nr:hypothetical protein MTsPCn5_30940 [Croceitalea sp. MTPC5]